MNGLLLLFSAALVVAQFALPRRLAFLPLLIAACHTPYNVALGGEFTAVRLVLLAGLCRAALGGLLVWNPRRLSDVLMIVWSGFALLSALGHSTGNPLVYRAGMVFNVLGTYLYCRAYIRSFSDFQQFVRSALAVIIPLAALLVLEALTGNNAYHGLGARFAEALVREARNRAIGPFGSPILAGTLGAIWFPLFAALWPTHRRMACLGCAASVAIVVASASSGPIGTLLLAAGALWLWRWRAALKRIKLVAVLALFVVQLFRERSIWYLISLIDFVGGSTGWHRSRLLDMASSNLGEWWLFGTDYTRHWMPYGLPSNPNHCDLTSYYVHLAVIGGLPLLLSLIALLWCSFRQLGARMRALRGVDSPDEFVLWCVGSAFFAHAITFFTISYFDQVYVFFYALVAAVPSLVAIPAFRRPVPADRPAPVEPSVPVEITAIPSR